jgi:predicted site-specific integrase-resolvase
MSDGRIEKQLWMEEQLLRAGDLAQTLGLQVATVRRWTYERKIPCVRIGKRAVRYRLRDVERVLLRDEPARATGGER